MLLFDKVVKQATHHPVPLLRDAFKTLAQHLKKAERFVLRGDAVAAMFNVAQSRPTSLKNAMPWALAPYPVMWLEWAERDIAHAETKATAATFSEERRPHRVGVLIRTSGAANRGVMTLCWDFPGSRDAEMSRIQQLFDWRENDHDIEELVEKHGLRFPGCIVPTAVSPLPASASSTRYLSQQARNFFEQDDERMAMYEMRRRTWSVPSRYLHPHVRPGSIIAMDPAAYNYGMLDWNGEMAFVIASLTLLNVRSYVEIDMPPNARRMARRSKPRRLPYSDVKLVLPEHQGARAAEQGASNADIRRHLVRGHFKVRKTGVYWWRHHPRGSGAPMPRDRYQVRQ